MEVACGDRTYRWIDDWVRIPEPDNGSGRTHGVTVTTDGSIVVFAQTDPAVRFYGADGELRDAWGSDLLGAHGLTRVVEDGTEYLWLTDVDSGAVRKMTLDGDIVQRLDPPDHPAYDDGEYAPSWVAVDERRHGGTGDVWVTDGYGEFYVHRYDQSGRYCDSLDGTEDGGPRFDFPHGLSLDVEGRERRILLADAENQRIRVYRPDGTETRSFGTEFLTSPRGTVRDGDKILIPDLFANKLTVVDEDDDFVGHLGTNPEVSERDDWPNVPRSDLEPGLFNSPHDAAVDDEGAVYVVEWIEGGRVIKLEPAGTTRDG